MTKLSCDHDCWQNLDNVKMGQCDGDYETAQCEYEKVAIGYDNALLIQSMARTRN